MPDEIIALPKYGSSSGEAVPIKAVDNGDGTYALSVSEGTISAIRVAMPQSGGSEAIPMATVDNLDGTYSLRI